MPERMYLKLFKDKLNINVELIKEPPPLGELYKK